MSELNLEVVPDDCLIEICDFLSLSEIIGLREVSKSFYTIATNDYIWSNFKSRNMAKEIKKISSDFRDVDLSYDIFNLNLKPNSRITGSGGFQGFLDALILTKTQTKILRNLGKLRVTAGIKCCSHFWMFTILVRAILFLVGCWLPALFVIFVTFLIFMIVKLFIYSFKFKTMYRLWYFGFICLVFPDVFIIINSSLKDMGEGDETDNDTTTIDIADTGIDLENVNW